MILTIMPWNFKLIWHFDVPSVRQDKISGGNDYKNVYKDLYEHSILMVILLGLIIVMPGLRRSNPKR